MKKTENQQRLLGYKQLDRPEDDIREQVIDRMIALDLTMYRVSQMTGVGQNVILRWLKGRSTGTHIVSKIVSALRGSIAWSD